jgi:acyl-CoA thioesterase-1
MMQRSVLVRAALVLSIACASACGPSASTDTGRATPAQSPAPADLRPATSDTRPRVVFLGDSLTAGLGLAADEAYPALIQQRIDAQGLQYQIVNAGVSGDTSFDALSRLDWALEGDVRVLVVALGGNDGLRGLPAEQLQKNLATIIERAQGRGIRVILAGMEAPPNFGESYIVAFHKVYPALAKKYGVPFVPFLLQGVAGIDGLNQRDGIHPTAEGARTVADNVWSVLRPTLKGT